jgi:hypothetical protein
MEQKQESEKKSVVVNIPGTSKSYEIKKQGNAQFAKICRLLFSRADYDADDPLAAISRDSKLACKVAAAIVLHGFFTMKMKWWYLWRWFYYVRQYDVEQLNELLSEGIAALPYEETMNAYSMLSATRETLKYMTFGEAQKLFESSQYLEQLKANLQAEQADTEK